MNVVWLFVQAAFWVSLMLVTIAAVVVVVLGPPFLVARFVLRRLRA